MWALIENDKVVETTVIDPEGRFHQDFVWIACPNQVVDGWSYEGGKFLPPVPVLPSLADAKTKKIEAMTAACAVAIVSGYHSDALGSAHFYPSALTDQINMMGSVTASLLPGLSDDWSTPFWCQDESGVWAYRLHTTAEIQQAGSDGKSNVITCQSTLGELSDAVAEAETIEEVEAIVWMGG